MHLYHTIVEHSRSEADPANDVNRHKHKDGSIQWNHVGYEQREIGDRESEKQVGHGVRKKGDSVQSDAPAQSRAGDDPRDGRAHYYDKRGDNHHEEQRIQGSLQKSAIEGDGAITLEGSGSKGLPRRNLNIGKQ